MPSKEKAYSQDKTTARQRSNQPEARQFEIVDQPLHPATILQRAKANPRLLTPANMRQLQRTLGNQAVGRLLTKTGSAQSAIQRQLTPEKEEKLMMKPATPGVGPEGGKVPPQVESAINRARGSGQPLESTVQKQMSHKLGHDFSGVRIHTGSEADTLNQQLSAKAFTTGRDIFFRRGTYNPASNSGRQLIAHELSHVVQQSTGRIQNCQSDGVTINIDRALEAEADVLGGQAARGEMARVNGDRLGVEIQSKSIIQPKLGFEIEMAVLVDINGRPVSEKTSLGRISPHLELTVDQNPMVEAPTPTPAAGGAYDLPVGWERIAAHIDAEGNINYYSSEEEARTAHSLPLPGEKITPAYRKTANGRETLLHPAGPGMGMDRYASIIEIVTNAYEPETQSGAQNIREAMTAAQIFADYIKTNVINHHQRVQLNRIPNVTVENEQTHIGNPNNHNQTVNASIQSTLGVDIAQLPAFIKSSIDPFYQGPFKIKHAAEAEEQQGALVQRELLESAKNADAVINEIGNVMRRTILPNKRIELHHIRGLFVLICQYLRLGKYAYDPATARWGLDKNAVALMSRTDLSKIFKNLPSDQRTWLSQNIATVKNSLLLHSHRSPNSTLFTDPNETQQSAYHSNVTAVNFINNVFTQDVDGVTAQFGAIKEMGPEVVKQGGLFGIGEKKGPVFEIRNMVPPNTVMDGRFEPTTWMNLAKYFIALLSTLNLRPEAMQTELSAQDLGFRSQEQVNMAYQISQLIEAGGTDPRLIAVMERFKRTTTRVTTQVLS